MEAFFSVLGDDVEEKGDGSVEEEEEEVLMDQDDIDCGNIAKACISDNTRKDYTRYNKHWMAFLRANHPENIGPDGNMLPTDAVLHCFTKFLASRKRTTGCGYATLNGHKSAFLDMWRSLSSTAVSTEWKEKFKQFFKGLKRIDAQEKRAGQRKVKEGKDPLPYLLYKWVCKQFLIDGDAFAHAYATLTWNLMCRTNNTQDVALLHMRAANDSIGVSFAYTKADQGGENANELKHVYANPLDPSICPVLALAIYFSTSMTWSVPDADGEQTATFVFPQNTQTSRFTKCLNRLWSTEKGKAMLLAFGITAIDIGAHSFRKGSTTYASQGSSGGASMVSVNIRGNWKMGNVKDRYNLCGFFLSSELNN